MQGVVGHDGLHKFEEGVSDFVLIEPLLRPILSSTILILLVRDNIEGLVDQVQVGVRPLKVVGGLL